MRKIALILTSAVAFGCACNNSGNSSANTDTADTVACIEFDSKYYDFGQITKGEVVEHVYTFTNTGNSDLLVQEVDPSCGCTTPEWTKEPVKPGKKGKIRVKYDTKSQGLGNKQKQVSVYSNTIPTRNILQFSAQVVGE